MKPYQPPPDLLKNRVILVTGAGQGIGRAAALAFAAHGATVILHGRQEARLNAVYDEIERAGHPKPVVFALDLMRANDAEFQAMAEAIGAQLGRLDGILHNAAERYLPAPLELQPLEQWLKHLRVGLAAAAAINRACAPLLKAAPDASVVMTSETHGHVPKAYWGAFAVSKAGVEALVKIQADEWELYPQLRINAVIPGPVRSPQRIATHPGIPKEQLPDPTVLMPAYLYLMGPDSQGISGEIIDCQTWIAAGALPRAAE
ncbi:MAG: NAD(P)-dependent oxidoreductase [Azospira oryzae]|nr:MAG: NAD(P)-dependent oxidoreductase [Azospira oryzae]PZP82904.1 MAG: NAD(P)-dependent oxidoreductase [Azospira oryzae]